MRGLSKVRSALTALAMLALALGSMPAGAAGLQGEASLFLDQYAVPTVQAENEHVGRYHEVLHAHAPFKNPD